MQQREDLKLILRGVTCRFLYLGIQAGWIPLHVHMQEAVRWNDSPAGGHVPIQEKLRAISARVGLVIVSGRRYQMGRPGTSREVRIKGLAGSELVIKAVESRDIQRHSFTNLRAIAGLKVVQPLGLGISGTKCLR